MNVKRMLSLRVGLVMECMANINDGYGILARVEAQKELDNLPVVDVIIFTGRLANDSTARPSAEAPDASPSWNTQSASGSCQSSSVSQQRLLRLRRSSTGQVRDAAPGSHRQWFHQPVRACLRLLTPVVLSG